MARSSCRNVTLGGRYAHNFTDFYAAEFRKNAQVTCHHLCERAPTVLALVVELVALFTRAACDSQLLERMRVLPANGFISEEEWEVAHTYTVRLHTPTAVSG